MTIFTDYRCFEGYPLSAVDPALAKALLATGMSNGTRGNALKAGILRLECFLQITRQTLCINELGDAAGRAKLLQFNSALYSPTFHLPREPWALAATMRSAFCEVSSSLVYPSVPCTLNQSSWPPDFLLAIAEFEAAEKDAERLQFWQGWSAKNISGKKIYFRFWELHDRYGADFTNEFFLRCEQWIRGRRTCPVTAVVELAPFLARYPTLVDFSNAESVGSFFTDFFRHFFRTKHETT